MLTRTIFYTIFLLALVSVATAYTIDADESFTIDLDNVLNISLNESNVTSITVNIPVCNTTADCPDCPEIICPQHNQSDLDKIADLENQIQSLNAIITTKDQNITSLQNKLEIANNNITFYKTQISNLTSEMSKKENYINSLLNNKTVVCPECPQCPTCPTQTCPSYNLSCPKCPDCPEPMLAATQNNPVRENPKPSPFPWVLAGVLAILLAITFVNLVKVNGGGSESGSESGSTSAEFNKEFGGD